MATMNYGKDLNCDKSVKPCAANVANESLICISKDFSKKLLTDRTNTKSLLITVM